MRFAGGLAAVLFGTAIVIVQVQVASALTPAEVAQQITVRIDGANTGSGVIIERQGSNYTVVTNWHVVQEKGNYTVYTQDGKQYIISQIKRLPNVDLAVFQFTSNQNYQVAQKGDSDQITRGKTVHVAGYPEGTSDLLFLSGSISSLVRNPKDGYALVYTVNAFPGMSGGPILDEQGILVGIHGRVKTRPDTNATIVSGIPLKTYLSFASANSPVSTVSPTFNSSTRNSSTIATALASRNGSFGTLNKALEAAGLTKILQGQGSFTIFAPTDAAFAKLPQDAVRDLLKPENVEVLLKILKYHIVANKILSRNLKTGNLKSFEGQNISVNVNSAKGVTVNDATLIQTDIETNNGVIHAIDNVILPPDL